MPYVWGSDDRNHDKVVRDNQIVQTRLSRSPPIYGIFFRASDGPLRLDPWTEPICIDRENESKKSFQVSIMEVKTEIKYSEVE
jgi:hypothetical protein